MSEKRSTTRYRIRNKDLLLQQNFYPWGLLGLLLILLPLLYALFWYAKHEIQHTVETEIKKQLVSQNLEWVDVEVDGQAVTLSGQGSKQEGDRAISIANKVEGPAWLGRFVIPSVVDGTFSEPTEAALDLADQSLSSTIEPTVIEESNDEALNNESLVDTQEILGTEDLANKQEELKAEQGWGNLIAQLDGGVLTLSGTVGSQAEKLALVEAANDSLDPPRLTKVIDTLEISKHSLNPNSQALARRASELISVCSSGQSSSIEGVFSIQCQAKRDQVENIQALAIAPIDGVEIGTIAINSSDDCNKSFVEILDGKSIRFSIGSANLKSSSAPLLDKIADIAKSCPGSVRVEGHTDKTGSFDSNMALSESRAQSVVEALVEQVIPPRLTP